MQASYIASYCKTYYLCVYCTAQLKLQLTLARVSLAETGLIFKYAYELVTSA